MSYRAATFPRASTTSDAPPRATQRHVPWKAAASRASPSLIDTFGT